MEQGPVLEFKALFYPVAASSLPLPPCIYMASPIGTYSKATMHLPKNLGINIFFKIASNNPANPITNSASNCRALLNDANALRQLTKTALQKQGICQPDGFIDERYRLQSSNEFEAAEIGLTIVESIITHYGCQLLIKSAVNKGQISFLMNRTSNQI